jgi:hypothetical protein
LHPLKSIAFHGALSRQLWDFDEVEQLFPGEWFLQNGPTRNKSDMLLSIFLVNGLHQFYAVHAFVLYVSQHKIKRAFLLAPQVRLPPTIFSSA